MPARTTSTPGNPGGTISAVVVMAGLAGTITPAVTGNVMIQISMAASNATVADGCTTRIRIGTGTAPVNGAATTGTTVGNAISITSAVAADPVGMMNIAYATGNAIGTPLWIDLGFSAITGGAGHTCTLTGITIVAIEV